jgi:hypothetical protein
LSDLGKRTSGPTICPDSRQGRTRLDIEDDLPDAHLFCVEATPKYLEEITNFLEEGKAPEDLSTNKKKVLALKETPFTIINEYLYKMGHDDVLRRCALEHEREDIINEAHAGPVGGHFQADTTA